jgi:hypothetical protein
MERKMRGREQKKIENRWQDKAAAWIAGNIIKGLLFILRVLQKWGQQLTLRQKKILLIVFCLIGSAYFFFLLRNALLRWPAPHSIHGFTQVKEDDKPPPATIFGINKNLKTVNHEQTKKP